MALPSTVTGEWSDWLNAKHGPFEVGGNLYVVTVDKTNNLVFVQKSIDGGDTWNEMDSGNHPTYSGDESKDTISAAVLSTTIYIAYQNASRDYCVPPFATSTDTWGTAVINGPNTSSAVVSDTGVNAFHLAVRADGSYVVGYQGPTNANMGTAYRTVRVSRYVSGAWQTAQVVSDLSDSQINSDFRGMVGPDASGRCHIFYAVGGSGTTTLYWKTLLADNTLSVEASLASGRSGVIY